MIILIAETTEEYDNLDPVIKARSDRSYVLNSTIGLICIKDRETDNRWDARFTPLERMVGRIVELIRHAD